MLDDNVEKIAMIVGFALAFFLVFSFIMASQTDIPFFDNVIDAIMGFITNVGGTILIVAIVLIVLIIVAPGILIGLLILAGLTIVVLLGIFIWGLFA